MEEIHYALDTQGNYQVTPGDIELAREHELDANFDPIHLNTIVAVCKAKGLEFVALTVNIHEDVQ